MRRQELACDDPALFREAADRCEVGYLGLVTADGTPRVVPLNFAALDTTIYFHGALAGEKHDLLRGGARGACTVVDDLQEKARALQALMRKYQPEGKHRPIDAADPIYLKPLRGVGVFRIVVESWTGKVKFGVNEPERIRRLLIAGLRERGRPLDLATALEIERTLD
jgi:nitroimidazol reductase NimA-like FMN-containing flavoprotein (pyridoxamine 5'-phosphate oxidase superfamily)